MATAVRVIRQKSIRMIAAFVGKRMLPVRPQHDGLEVALLPAIVSGRQPDRQHPGRPQSDRLPEVAKSPDRPEIVVFGGKVREIGITNTGGLRNRFRILCPALRAVLLQASANELNLLIKTSIRLDKLHRPRAESGTVSSTAETSVSTPSGKTET